MFRRSPLAVLASATVITILSSTLPVGQAWGYVAEPSPSPEVREDPLEDRVRVVLVHAATEYLSHRAEAITQSRDAGIKPLARLESGAVRLSASATATESRVLAGVAAFRAHLKYAGESFSKTATSITVQEATQRGNEAKVELTETTLMFYAKVRGDEPPLTSFSARHLLSFQKEQATGTWTLVSDNHLEPTGLMPLHEAMTFVKSRAQAAGSRPALPPTAAEKPAATVRPPTSQSTSLQDQRRSLAWRDTVTAPWQPTSNDTVE